jgi:hypothetical protein
MFGCPRGILRRELDSRLRANDRRKQFVLLFAYCLTIIGGARKTA